MVASVFTDDALYVSFTGNSREGGEAIASYVNTMRSRVTDVIRVGDVAETDEGAFTWVIEGNLAGDRVSGMLEAELDGDLFSRLNWAEDPEPLE